MNDIKYPTAQEWVKLSLKAQKMYETFLQSRELGVVFPITYLGAWSCN